MPLLRPYASLAPTLCLACSNVEDSPDVEVLVLGDLGELAAVLGLDVLDVVVVVRLELPGPGAADENGGDADEEPLWC